MKRGIAGFKGEVPIINSRLLPASSASICVNAKLWSGSLRPYRGNLQYFTPTKPGIIKTIFRYAGESGDPNSGYIFHWDKIVDVIRGPVKEDAEKRAYFTGDGVPKYTWFDIATVDTFYPSNDFDLGVPEPSIGPTATPNADGTADENVDLVTRVWAVTFVTPQGEEGPPLYSNEVTVLPDQTTDLTGLPTPPSGDWNLGAGAFKRIYRTATGEDGTGFYLEADAVPIAQDTFTSSIADSALGGLLETTNWMPPLPDLHSLIVLTNGVCAGASGNTVYYSETNLPHAWNPLNSDIVIHPVVGLGKIESTIVCCTTKNPVLITGSSPDTMYAYELDINQGCVSKQSIASFAAGVAYASPDGLILIGPGGEYQNATESLFSREEWQALRPESMMGVVHDNTYYCFYDNGTEAAGFILDPRSAEFGIIQLPFHATAAYSDSISDQLLLVVDNQVVVFDKGAASSYQWRSKLHEEIMPFTFTVGRVVASSYTSLTLNLYVDGVRRCSMRVKSRAPFRLPGGYRGNNWQVELIGVDDVVSVELAEAMEDLT